MIIFSLIGLVFRAIWATISLVVFLAMLLIVAFVLLRLFMFLSFVM